MPKIDAALSCQTSWKHALIVCRKCGKKLKGGFGDKGKDSLKSVLRQALREAGQRREIRVLETSCLSICPKGGVTALNAGHPGVVHIIPLGIDGEDAVQKLLG